MIVFGGTILFPIYVTLFGIISCVIAVSSKHLLPILLRPSGKVTEVRFLQSLNVLFSSFFTLFGMTTFVIDVFVKHHLPILVTVLGILISLIGESLKHQFPMLSNPSFNVTLVNF